MNTNTNITPREGDIVTLTRTKKEGFGRSVRTVTQTFTGPLRDVLMKDGRLQGGMVGQKGYFCLNDEEVLRTANVVQTLATAEEQGDLDDCQRDDAPQCEGHADDDAALTSGVGIGEPTYCDGSCVPQGDLDAGTGHGAYEYR